MGCKVETLTDRYDLTVPGSGDQSLDEYLVTRWTGRDGRSADGYKSLTEWFNKRLLKALYADADRETLGVHLDREYELVTGEDDVERDELAAALAADGLDIERIERELISWSTMRHHLKGCLDAEKDTGEAATDWESNTVEVARQRTEEKAQSVLSSLASKARLADAESAEVDVQVKLGCPDCSVRVPFDEAVDRGYVCEQHVSAEGEEKTVESWKNTLLAVVTPYGVAEAVQGLLLEEPFLVEALVLPAL
ncbi:rod-determining factor RdfA [Haloarcula onubensis]|uniref:Uncharacterized protein n=1 Tax=Haloarcula onubensis TaxID=2950539 RepID=A0ABU2FPM0_9EURY|nr:rod-determining factor RdfA [Halomicroarcula sp. S3CR25-11]MDS0282700.1 hypothetical protein [Halomicroarcula sp. S3CR25-11]